MWSGSRLWPGRPAPLQGESFSSWFVRVAGANGHRPRELYRVCMPAGDRSPPDLDRHADPLLIRDLAEATGIPVGSISGGTFDQFAGMAFERDEDGRNVLPWLPPAGRYAGKRCFGQQVCPRCLAEDPVPHLRLTWRLGVMTKCPKHGTLLLDRCPECREPIAVLRQDGRSAFFCWSCGSAVRAWRAGLPPVDIQPVQATWMEIVSRGWTKLGAYGPVYSFAALEILALLMRLLAGGQHAYPLRAWVGERAPGACVPPTAIPRVRDLAHLAPAPRSILLMMADWLMQDWPHRFVAAGRSVGLATSHIRRRHGDTAPFAFAHAVDWHLNAAQRTGTRAEIERAKEILTERGVSPTCRNLVELVGTKLTAIEELAEPASDGAPWGKGRYWKLDGVSPEVKEAARTAAHRAGEGVGPWLDALLRERLNLPAKREHPETCSNTPIISR
ncbi:TniQ family protein [Rhodocista pekingensis]|uniref:TniQ family protein n=1 Tax=Rhodocista pekingensis TaxID=201185 RepID=A0ABW2KVZ7_9PROT